MIVRDNRLLLVRGDGDGRFWTLPGGRMDLGEGIEACVIREAYEETGLRVSVGPLFAVSEFYDEAEAFHIVQMIFHAAVEEGELQQDWIDQGGPVQEARFFTAQEVRDLPVVFPDFLREGEWANPMTSCVYRGAERKKSVDGIDGVL